MTNLRTNLIILARDLERERVAIDACLNEGAKRMVDIANCVLADPATDAATADYAERLRSLYAKFLERNST